MSLIPKPKTKRKKFLAVSLKESISLSDKFLHAPRLKRILQRVILLSVLVIFSTPSSICLTIGLSSCTMKCFSPYKPKESKKKISVLVQYPVYSTSDTWFFTAVRVCYYKGVFPLVWYHRSIINKLIPIIRRKYTNTIIFLNHRSQYF